ncbi:WG repeat-containing protein [Pseudanabaena sp. FACHB-1998]|uniref:WG repeat-containing protein n=1 Tax=Pseudanabaena sp. FACHB-1998 TaxID=2692858 RepID=UPI0016808F41|nr:WG repeat-containing protein [Pseudanabaena sp. FACHB-1998]MBD2178304.1 WG repeat-containing protein [Pseudanabaena sp. FACHB-1998]
MNQIYPVPVKIGNKYGYEDETGRVVIQPLFDFAREFSEGLAAVKQGICWQFIDLTGNIILDGYPVIYSNGRKANALIYDVKDFKDGTAWILAFADESYRHTARCSDGDYITYDKKWGSIDKQGKVVIEPQFDEVPWGFSNGLAPVVMKGLRGFVDKQYKIVVQPQFQKICAFWIEPFSEGWALAARQDKYCWLNR